MASSIAESCSTRSLNEGLALYSEDQQFNMKEYLELMKHLVNSSSSHFTKLLVKKSSRTPSHIL